MAISRYNRPAEQPIIDTYVPLPFREIKEAITNKQKDYDITESTYEKTPSILDNLNVHKVWQDAYGNDIGENIGFKVIEAKKDQIRKQQQALFDKYQGDWSKPEAQKEIRAFANSVANWYENTGKPLQNKSNLYLKEKEEASKKKNELGYQNIYNKFNDQVYNEVRKGQEVEQGKRNIDYDWQSPTYNEYLDKSEAVNKAASNLGSLVKEWSGGRKVNLDQLTAEEYKTFRESNKSQVETAKNSLLSQLNQKHQQEAFELARQLAPNEGISPEELYNKKISYKDSKGRKVESTWGELQKRKLDQEVASLFDSKLNIHTKDLTDYSNLSKEQLGSLGIGEDGKSNNTYGIVQEPVQNIQQDYLNPESVKDLSFQDFLISEGYKPKETGSGVFINDKGEEISAKYQALAPFKTGSKEEKKYNDLKSKFELFRNNKLPEKQWVEQFAKINPLAKKITEQYPNINKKELEKTYNNLVSIRSEYSHSKRLNTENKDALKENLIGDRIDMNFQGYINNTSLTDESGQQFNFRDIRIPEFGGFFSGNPTIGEILEEGDKEKISRLYKMIDVGTDIVGGNSIGGDYIKIGNNKYMTGGVTPKQKAILQTYNILNEPVKNITKGITESKEVPVGLDANLYSFSRIHPSLKNVPAENLVVKTIVDVKNPFNPKLKFYEKSGKDLKDLGESIDYKTYIEGTQETYDKNSPYITKKREEDKGKVTVNEDLNPIN